MPAILIVDDDLNLLSGVRRVLREQPYELFTANSTEMAIAMFERQPFDLVVADLEMSGKSGLELIKWLAIKFPDTIRIMLTGQANIEVAKRAINEGKVFRFLTKPCHDVELALAIRKGLESKMLC